MSSSIRDEVHRHLNTVGLMQPALHDVGGEADAPIQYHEKEEEVRELNTLETEIPERYLEKA